MKKLLLLLLLPLMFLSCSTDDILVEDSQIEQASREEAKCTHGNRAASCHWCDSDEDLGNEEERVTDCTCTTVFMPEGPVFVKCKEHKDYTDNNRESICLCPVDSGGIKSIHCPEHGKKGDDDIEDPDGN